MTFGISGDIFPTDTLVKLITTISTVAKAPRVMQNSRVPKLADMESRDLIKPVMKKISKEYVDMLHQLATKNGCLEMPLKLKTQPILRERSLPTRSSTAVEYNVPLSDYVQVFTKSDELGNVYIEGYMEDGYFYELHDGFQSSDIEAVNSEGAHSPSWTLLYDNLEIPGPREEGSEEYDRSLAALDDEFEMLIGSCSPSQASLDEPFEIPEPTTEEMEEADRLRNS